MKANNSVQSPQEFVILVDENDTEIGVMEKMEAHKKGLLHRAFSFFVFNSKGEMLIQRRAFSKYHSQGLWTNACCSHPRPNEPVEAAAERRIWEEMGIQVSALFLFHFIYKAEVAHGLTEHELDYVFIGQYDGEPNPDPEEVSEWKYIDMQSLKQFVSLNPENYTIWFKIIWEKVRAYNPKV